MASTYWVHATLLLAVLALASTETLLEGIRNPRGWQASLDASEKLLKRVRDSAPALTAGVKAGVSSLLPQDDLSWSKINLIPKPYIGSQTPVQTTSAPSFPARKEELGEGTGSNLSVDHLWLPAMAIILLTLLIGYHIGRATPAQGTARQGTRQLEGFFSSSQSDDLYPTNPVKQPDFMSSGCNAVKSAMQPSRRASPSNVAHDCLSKEDEVGLGLAASRQLFPEEFPEELKLQEASTRKGSIDEKSSVPESILETEAGAVLDKEAEDLTGVPGASIGPEPAAEVQEASEAEEDSPEIGSNIKERSASGNEASTSYSPPSAKPAREGLSPGWLQDGGKLRDTRAGWDVVDDVGVVMEALVTRLRLDSDLMSPQERMQLLQMALQCCQHRERSWLHQEANELQHSQAETAMGTLNHLKEQAAGKESRRKTKELSMYMQDGLLSGLVLMIVITLFCGVKCGYLGRKLSRCPMLSSLSPPSFWRPWASLDYVSVVWCWVHSSSEALLGCGIILGVAYVAVRGGVYQGTTFQAPLLKLGIGLGLICGLAGYLAVGKMGGEAIRWLYCWETWVALHLTAAWQLPMLQLALSTGEWRWTKNVVYHACLSFLFPIAMSTLPFEGCAYSLLSFRKVIASLLLD